MLCASSHEEVRADRKELSSSEAMYVNSHVILRQETLLRVQYDHVSSLSTHLTESHPPTTPHGTQVQETTCTFGLSVAGNRVCHTKQTRQTRPLVIFMKR